MFSLLLFSCHAAEMIRFALPFSALIACSPAMAICRRRSYMFLTLLVLLSCSTKFLFLGAAHRCFVDTILFSMLLRDATDYSSRGAFCKVEHFYRRDFETRFHNLSPSFLFMLMTREFTSKCYKEKRYCIGSSPLLFLRFQCSANFAILLISFECLSLLPSRSMPYPRFPMICSFSDSGLCLALMPEYAIIFLYTGYFDIGTRF